MRNLLDVCTVCMSEYHSQSSEKEQLFLRKTLPTLIFNTFSLMIEINIGPLKIWVPHPIHITQILFFILHLPSFPGLEPSWAWPIHHLGI